MTEMTEMTETHESETQLQDAVARSVQQAMEVALDCHRAGYLPQAEDAYRAILGVVPEHADANHNLAVIALQSGHALASVALFRKALEGQPENLTYWLSLFDAMLQCGDIAGATDALERKRCAGLSAANIDELIERIVELRFQNASSVRPVDGVTARPGVAQMAEITQLFATEKLELALDRAAALVYHFPGDAFGWKVQGAALINLGRCGEAMKPLQRAVELAPQDTSALSNFGFALQVQGCLVDSEIHLRLALRYQPDFAAAQVNLGATLLRQDRYEDAAKCFMRSLEIEPGYLPAYNHLAQANEESAHLIQALACYRKTLDIYASQSAKGRAEFHLQGIAYAHQGISSTLAKLADYTDVLEQTDKAIALLPQDRVLWERRLYNLSYHPDMTAADIFAEFVRWGDRFAVPDDDFSRHDRTPGRRIKVGYVSPDFRRHTSRFYFYPFFSNHNHDVVELYAYSNVKAEDDITARFRGCFDHWRDIRGLDDEQAAALIRADGIDILVDACNHMRDDRLGVFALKPAPIQATWLGAAWTTGLKAVDYVLFDRYIAPPETLARENIVRLAHCFVPFQPLDVTDEPKPPPCVRNGYITFAYSGRTERLNHHTFRVWGEILRRMPTARLTLDFRQFSIPENRQHFLSLLRAQGVDTDRVSMRNSKNIFQGLHDFDVLLDCFPHSGGTMLLDALWMGVPALTLAGRPPLGRIGTTFMHNIGLPQWVAHDEQEYIDKACSFASDVAGLTQLRAGMRQRLLTSRLMDGKGFVRGVETAYRVMWERFCAGESASPMDVPATSTGD